MAKFRPWSLTLLCVAFLALEVTEAVKAKHHKGRHKQKDEEGGISSELKTPPNVCDSQHQQILCCYCDSVEFGTANEANCWVCYENPPGNTIWDSFSSQANLTRLTFVVRPGSSLSTVPTKALSRLPKLNYVKVQYATIAEVPSYALANASLIREATLARNQIMALRPSAFANLPMIVVLDLSENRLSYIPSDSFGPNLPELRRLFLDRNNISAIADKAFKYLPRLEELEIQGNELTDIHRSTFTGLESLRRLDLRSNRLTTIRDSTFMETPSLQELDIDENRLEIVEPKAFKGLHHLMRLRLRDNKLKSLSDNVFVGVNNVHFLDLRDNDLVTLTANAVEPLRRNLKNITMSFLLEGNNFVCDCRLAWMHEVHNETANERVRNTLEELKCRLHRDMGPAGAAAAAAAGVNLFPNEASSDDLMYSGAEEMGGGINANRFDRHHQGDDANAGRHQPDDYEYSDHEEKNHPVSGARSAAPDGSVVIHLLQIPPEALPCPEERRVMEPLEEDIEDEKGSLFGAEASADVGAGVELRVVGLRIIFVALATVAAPLLLT